MSRFDIGCPLDSVHFDTEARRVVLSVPHPCAPDMGKTLAACKRAFGEGEFDRVVVVDSLGEGVVSYALNGYGEWAV